MLKDKAKQKAEATKVNEIFINKDLYYIFQYTFKIKMRTIK